MPYVKLDTGILDSTLWLSDSDVRVVFITMLAMAHADGMCEATAPGIARRANLSIEAVRKAIQELEAPDEDSRSLDNEGRRVVRVDGGYFIVNYEKYRQKDYKATERMRRYRAKKKAGEARGVTVCARNKEDEDTSRLRNVTQAEAEAEAEQISPDGDIGDGSPPPCPQNEIVKLYHETLPGLRRVREWTEDRQRLLRARWREKTERQTLDWWREYFSQVSRSDFLMGRIEGDRPFQADLEWLIRPKNMPKVLEGKYDNNESGPGGEPFDGYEFAN